jgi:hypothetical protein
MFITIRDSPLTLFHIVYSATAYSTAQIVPSRDLYKAAHVLESQWISNHGAPSSLAADPEFARIAFKRLLTMHHIVSQNDQHADIRRPDVLRGKMAFSDQYFTFSLLLIGHRRYPLLSNEDILQYHASWQSLMLLV